MDEVLLDVARLMSTRGTCELARVGAVLTREGRVLSTGYNGAPEGMTHCEHSSSELEPPYQGDPYRSTCRTAVHAEANAVAFAARHGVALAGSVLFTTLSPCLACAQLLVNAGVVRVVFDIAYRDAAGLDLLRRAGVLVETPSRPTVPT